MQRSSSSLLAYLIVVGIVLLGACGEVGYPPGDPTSGKQLFAGQPPLSDPRARACSECHAVDAGQQSPLGPNLSNIGNRAATTVAGQSAEQYLQTSIIDPDAYLAGGFQEGIMYREYREALSPQQISDLVAYMLTLKSGQDE